MGDIRYDRPLDAILQATDRAATLRAMADEDVVAALAAAATRRADPYLSNVLASEAMNRIRRKNIVLDTAEEGVFAVDANGAVVYVNAAAQRLLGWTSSELHGRNMHEAVHHLDADGTPATVDSCDVLRVLTDGTTAHRESDVFVRKDGTTIPVAYTSSPVVRDGEVEGAVVVFHDITARQRAERLRRTRHEVTEVLATASSVDEAAPRLLQAVGRGLGWDAGAMWMFDTEAGVLKNVAFWSVEGLHAPNFEASCRDGVFSPGSGIPGVVWKTGKAFWVTDFAELPPENFPRAMAAAKDGLHGAVGFPCPIDRKPVAVMDFFARRLAQPDEEFLEMVDTMGSLIGQFIDRREAEVKLRHSEARKRGILDSALDAIVTIDHLGRILDFNPAAEQIFGYRAEDVIGRDLYSYIVPERFRAAHRAGMARYVASGESRILGQLLELPAVRRDGSEFPTEIYIVRVPDQDPPVFTSHLRDITARKRAQEALRAAEERYRNLFSATPDAVLATDVERRVVDANAAFAELTGYTVDELIGARTSLFYADDEEFRRMGQDLRSGTPGERIVRETTWRRKDGRTMPVEIHISQLTNDTGEVVGFIAAVRDLTQRRRLTEALERSHERYQHLYDRLPVMALRVRARDGVVLAANQRAADALGYRRDELEGLSVDALYPPECRPEVHQQIRRAIEADGDVVRLETRKQRKDGSTLWVIDDMRTERATAAADAEGASDAAADEGDEVTVLVACEDITALKVVQGIVDVALPRRPLPEMLDAMMRTLRDGLSVDTATVLTLEPGEDALAVRSAIGLEEEVRRALRVPLDQGFAGRVARERQPVLLMDPQPDQFVSPALRARGLRMLLGFPLLVEDRLVGVLHVGTERPHPLPPQHVRLLELVADRVALALDRARLDDELRRAKEEAARELAELRERLRGQER